MIFNAPESSSFYDNRILISWEISQPRNYPEMKNIQFKISGDPEVEFDPVQDPIIELPAIEDNKIILNWIIKKPTKPVEVQLSILTPDIQETHRLSINPES